jgi:hypothetical protein
VCCNVILFGKKPKKRYPSFITNLFPSQLTDASPSLKTRAPSHPTAGLVVKSTKGTKWEDVDPGEDPGDYRARV